MSTLRIAIASEDRECDPVAGNLLEHLLRGLRMGMFTSHAAWDPGWVTTGLVVREEGQLVCRAGLAPPAMVDADLVGGILCAPDGVHEGLPGVVVEYAGAYVEVGVYDSGRSVPGVRTDLLTMPGHVDRVQPLSIWFELRAPVADEQRDCLYEGLATFEALAGEGPFRGQCRQELSAIGATQLSQVGEGTFLYWVEAVAAPDAWVSLMANFLRHNRQLLGLLETRVEQ